MTRDTSIKTEDTELNGLPSQQEIQSVDFSPTNINISISKKTTRSMSDRLSARKDEWLESSDDDVSDIEWGVRTNPKRVKLPQRSKESSPEATTITRMPSNRGAKRQTPRGNSRRSCIRVATPTGEQFEAKRNLEEDRKLGYSMSKNAVDYRERLDVKQAWQDEMIQEIDQDILDLVDFEGGITQWGRDFKAGTMMIRRLKQGNCPKPTDKQVFQGASDDRYQELLTENHELKGRLDAALHRLSEIKNFVREN